MLNLIQDAWIPVRRKDGSRAVIAPWQMADDTLAFPDWPRPDLNIACLELLIGLVFLADPPSDAEDWQDRRTPDPERLREKLAPFAPAFELMGDGPRFCQDKEAFEAEGQILHPDTLFIDQADEDKQDKNSDLMVKRNRYPVLAPELAAIALFTLQSFAPAGGRGHMTSVRGGGPLVTLLDPGGGLWPLIWANVPDGYPGKPEDLPWINPARMPGNRVELDESDAPPPEAFFGMPRRLRLIARDRMISGVARRPNGINYGSWLHPLTPYRRESAASPFSSVKASPGILSYRNWLGVAIARQQVSDNDKARPARVVSLWQERSGGRHAEIIAAGWAMKKGQNKVLDFTFSRAPVLLLPDELAERVEGFVEAAGAIALALRGALAPVLAEGEAREAAREEFFQRTQGPFEARLARLTAAGADAQALARDWLADLRDAALAIFDAAALPGLAERDIRDQQKIVKARSDLTAAFAGFGKTGQGAYAALGLTPPETKRRKVA